MGFYIFISILIVIVCVLLGLIVLIQNPKGGGLSATFGGQGTQFMGARKTADFLEKGTWIFAIALFVLSLLAAYSIPRGANAVDEAATELSVDQNAAGVMPSMTAPAPTATTPASNEEAPE